MPFSEPSPWWQSFFDRDYLAIWEQVFPPELNEAQALAIWRLLELQPGCRILDAPCGWGRLSLPLARLGATLLAADQSADMITAAESLRHDASPRQLSYRQHDLRTPLPETGFDAALNVFTSFGYGSEDDDLAIFRTLHAALRPGGRLLVETNHRDLMCAFIARGSKLSLRLPDGTLFLDNAEFDPLTGVAHLHWYWHGPRGAGEKHALWRCYTPTEILALLARAGFRFEAAYSGFTPQPFKAEGPEAGGRLCIVAVRPE
jgi:SAM-dependent methyltransferase